MNEDHKLVAFAFAILITAVGFVCMVYYDVLGDCVRMAISGYYMMWGAAFMGMIQCDVFDTKTD